MILRNSQRSAIAERMCRKWIKRRGIRFGAPHVYVIRRTAGGSHVWGRSHNSKGFIVLHLGPKSTRADWYILLAHEFCHQLDYWTSAPRWRRENMPHGDRFQILLWKTLPRAFWKRASRGQWISNRSAHRPEFQPDLLHGVT
jgi:hypothetical protein